MKVSISQQSRQLHLSPLFKNAYKDNYLSIARFLHEAGKRMVTDNYKTQSFQGPTKRISLTLKLREAKLRSIIISMNKEEQKKKIRYADLPVHLQRKYKNSPIFAKENDSSVKRFEFDLQKLKARQAEKQKTIEEKLQQLKINPTQEKYLERVFNYLASPHNGKYFTEVEVTSVLKKLASKMSRKDIERMVWQFDDDLNKRITQRQYKNMYKRCTIDRSAAESKNLFHLTQFLMYCRPDRYRITVEDTLELLFVRAKLQLERNNQRCEEKDIIRKMQQEIEVIFQGQEKTPEGLEKEITFQQYLQRINKRAIEKRKREIQKAKSAMKYGSKAFDEND